MQKRFPVLMALLLAVTAGTAMAADPTGDQIYQAVRAGNLEQAQQMVDQVLADHPKSAKAHFVAAEVAARRNNFGAARQELAKAESIDPALSGISQRSVNELRAQLARALPLSSTTPTRVPAPQPYQMIVPEQRHSSHFLGWLFLIGGIVVVWMIIRRATYRPYPGPIPGPGPMGPMGGPMMGGPVMGGPMMGGGPVMMGGGPGIMGSLASGLAVGAGVAAGEELVHHMLDGRGGVGGPIPSAGAAEPYPQDYSNPNADMGGNDFGVSGGDDSSWGDSGGGGGGDDWT
jgi:hypothetical protein